MRVLKIKLKFSGLASGHLTSPRLTHRDHILEMWLLFIFFPDFPEFLKHSHSSHGGKISMCPRNLSVLPKAGEKEGELGLQAQVNMGSRGTGQLPAPQT